MYEYRAGSTARGRYSWVDGPFRAVTIETISQQGDGITKVERGYVVIVPETEVNDKVTIEITNVTDNFVLREVTAGRSEREH